MLIYCNVLFPEKWSRLYTYYSKKNIQIGEIVQTTVKNKLKTGVIIEFVSAYEKALEIIENSGYCIPINIINFIKKASEYNMFALGEGLKLCLKNVNTQYTPWYTYDNQIQSITYLIDQLGKRAFDKKIKLGEILSIDLQYPNTHIELNNIQQLAYENMVQFKEKRILLKGNTGSGKTGIYFKYITNYLNDQIFIMMPEISLTQNFLTKFKQEFNIMPHIWHHAINKDAKDVVFTWAISGKPGVIIGTRSALWLPFANLKCIIVDEEHDQSYKQESSPYYHGRDMSILLSQYTNAKCVLVSATPSLETLLNVKNKKIDLVSISKKQPIKVKIVKRSNGTWISPELKYEIQKTLENKNQCMLFLNRRGFASNIFCTICQSTLFCKFCSTNVIIYKNCITLCSYCGKKDLLKKCETCHNYKWKLYGIGIEKIHEDIKAIFPNTRIGLFSSDNDNLYKDIEKINQNEIDIIIATQVLSKGYTFPKLTLIGVVQADNNNALDPRNMEKIHQLLTQVRGRCGRVELEGTVILQTNNPNNQILTSIMKNDECWGERELEFRKTHDLPPYLRLIRIIAIHKIDNQSMKLITDIYNELKILENTNITIFPPAPAQLHKHNCMYRNSILIRYKDMYPQPIITKMLENIKKDANAKLIIDVDPYSFY